MITCRCSASQLFSMASNERGGLAGAELALFTESFPLSGFFLSSLNIPEVEIIFVVLVQFNLKHLVEQIVLFA